MISFCEVCGRFVNLVDGQCSVCSVGVAGSTMDDCFSSGTGNSKRETTILPPGTMLLERFSIIRLIANGRFGDLYLACDTYLGENVALKIAAIIEDDGQISARQLLHEARMFAKIRDHFHVIKVYGLHYVHYGQSDLVILAMEYADGGSLRRWLNENRNAPEVRRQHAIEFGTQMCRGVESANSQGIVLGDIKPENFFFVQGRLCAADFGAAIPDDGLVGSDSYAHYFDPREFSTPQYMPPEMFNATHPDETDVRANVYSIGIVLLEVLHEKCRRPFYGGYDRLAALHQSANVPPLTGVPEELSAVVSKCMAKSPGDRYQTVGDVREALERVAFDEGKSIEGQLNIEVSAETTERVDPVEETWRRACEAEESNDVEQARRLCDEVLREVSDHPGAMQMKCDIDELFNRVHMLYEEMAHPDGRFGLRQMLALVRQAVDLYPNHPSGEPVQEMLDERIQRHDRLVREGFAAVTELEWDSARQLFAQAATVGGEGAAVLNVLNAVDHVLRLRESERERINAAVARRDQNEACRLAGALDLQLSQWASDITQQFRRMEAVQ